MAGAIARIKSTPGIREERGATYLKLAYDGERPEDYTEAKEVSLTAVIDPHRPPGNYIIRLEDWDTSKEARTDRQDIEHRGEERFQGKQTYIDWKVARKADGTLDVGIRNATETKVHLKSARSVLPNMTRLGGLGDVMLEQFSGRDPRRDQTVRHAYRTGPELIKMYQSIVNVLPPPNIPRLNHLDR